MSLQRFHQTQAESWAGYSQALQEIRMGRKRGHWIWYVFPQIAGLGRSDMAREYALRDLGEACDYLMDPVLRGRYEEICSAVHDQLESGVALETLFGSAIDCQKFVSSLTLFHAAASRTDLQEGDRSLVHLCDHLLELAANQGYPVCEFTLGKL